MIICPHTSSKEACTVCQEFAMFAEAVAEMRHAQNKYFQTTAHGALSEAKRHEKRVDKFLKKMNSKQQEMF